MDYEKLGLVSDTDMTSLTEGIQVESSEEITSASAGAAGAGTAAAGGAAGAAANK